MKIDDGGPAFPSTEVYDGYNKDRGEYAVQSNTTEGMSLRDWFAGQVLTNANIHQGRSINKIAEEAYMIADAMLAERTKERTEP